jgi:hypothetical protein
VIVLPKLAIKTKKKILEKNVFLKRSYDGYMQYGKLELIDKREGHTNVIGIINDNLLQEDLIIEYNDELEKFKIIECIPRDFYYRVNMDKMKIYISFDQEPIKAHLFTNREYVDGFYKFLTCFDEEEDIILKVSLKSEELDERILKLRKDILKVKKEFYPKRFLKYEDAVKNVKTYLIYLMENYDVEVVESEMNEYLANLRKYYNNCDIDMYADLLRQGQDGFSFMFKLEGKIYKVTVGSKKTDRYFEDFDGFFDYYKEKILGETEGE